MHIIFKWMARLQAENTVTSFSLKGVRDAPFDIWRGRGARVYVGCKLFFTSVRIFFFFWRWTSDNFFLNFRWRTEIYIFVVCLPYYARYHLVFFVVNIVSSISPRCSPGRAHTNSDNPRSVHNLQLQFFCYVVLYLGLQLIYNELCRPTTGVDMSMRWLSDS